CQTPAASKPHTSPTATAMPPTRGVGLLWTLRRLCECSSSPCRRPNTPPASSRAPPHAETAAINTVIATATPDTLVSPPRAIRLVVLLTGLLVELRAAPEARWAEPWPCDPRAEPVEPLLISRSERYVNNCDGKITQSGWD